MIAPSFSSSDLHSPTAGESCHAPTLQSLRPYQQLAVEHTRRALDRGERAVYFSLPTGTGKTTVLSHLTDGFDHVLVLAHRIELIDQLARRFRSDWDRRVGIVRADENDWDAEIVVATPQTLRGHRLEPLLETEVDLLMVDEAHHVTPGSRYDLIGQQVGAPIVGCTATPFRADKQRMQDVLPVCTFSRTIDEMQSEGWLCPLVWRPVEVSVDLSDIESAATPDGRDYRIEVLAEAMRADPVVEAVVTETAPLLGDRPTVAFAADIMHAQLLAEGYRNAGIRAEAVWGTMPKDRRREILTAWHAGSIQLVSNCAVITEGYDFPAIAALVMARPTRSPGLFLQMVGRGTRTAPGKDTCLVLDITGKGELNDTTQVVLPDMVSVTEYEDILEAEEDDRPARQTGLPIEKQRQFSHFRDPAKDVVYRWIRDAGRYILPAGDDITMVLQADPQGSGLYHLAMLRRESRRRLSRHPDTIWEQRRLAALWLEQHAVPALSHRDQPWHAKPPSERQLRFLGNLDTAVAARARSESWTRVQVGDEITRLLVKAHESSLLTDLWRHAS